MSVIYRYISFTRVSSLNNDWFLSTNLHGDFSVFRVTLGLLVRMLHKTVLCKDIRMFQFVLHQLTEHTIQLHVERFMFIIQVDLLLIVVMLQVYSVIILM